MDARSTTGPAPLSEEQREKESWGAIKRAAERSNWIRPGRHWIGDACRFLRLGPAPVGAGFDEAAWSTVIVRPTLRWAWGLLIDLIMGRKREIIFTWGQDLWKVNGVAGHVTCSGGVPTAVRDELVKVEATRERAYEDQMRQT